MDTETPRTLDKQVKDYLDELIKFFLEDCQVHHIIFQITIGCLITIHNNF